MRLGCHLIAELGGCPPDRLESAARVESLMTEGARAAGATVVEWTFHQFNPYGVSGVVVIAESHVTIHTWPELGYAAIDAFTCGDEALAQAIVTELNDRFSATSLEVTRLERGPALAPHAQAR